MPPEAGHFLYEFKKFMQFKILLKQKTIVLVFLGLTVYTASLFYFIPKNPVQGDTKELTAVISPSSLEEPVRQPLPVQLRIPVIGVDSIVESVGLTSDGAMDVPKDVDDVGWFNLGSRPGEAGTAVIDGHYGISKGKASIFDNLYKLRKGDKIYVQDDAGAVTTFVVREDRRYGPKADATPVFSSSDDKSHLNLITCEGIWDDATKTYTERLVVFADKE